MLCLLPVVALSVTCGYTVFFVMCAALNAVSSQTTELYELSFV